MQVKFNKSHSYFNVGGNFTIFPKCVVCILWLTTYITYNITSKAKNCRPVG